MTRGDSEKRWRSRTKFGAEREFYAKIFLSSPAARKRRSIAPMRFYHLLVSLAVIFITIIAVEGLPQSASQTSYPSSSPQAVESPAKKQPAKKKGWWIFGSKASPAKTTATPTNSSPVVEGGKTKKQKSNPSVTATPIVVTASPHETVTRAAVTPSAGRRSGSGVGQYLKSCLSLPEIALVR
jgi:hypothetical protein